jgi:hypothetical protein
MKSQKLLKSFTAYCKAFPAEMFWQALRNWSEYSKIYGEFYNEEFDDYELIDTFYKK